MSERFMDVVNRSPVTFGVLGLYLLFALLTDVMSPTGEQLVEYGAAVPLLIMDGDIWRLVSHCFLHGGWLHLGLNAYALFLFGPLLEHRLGSLKFAILYLVAGIAGGIAAMLWPAPAMTLVGGSGALFGMLGAILASNLRSGRHFMEVMNHPGTRTILILLAVNLALGWLLPMISNSAHIGGLIGGFIATFCFLDRGRFKADASSRVIQAGWIAMLLSMVFYVLFPVVSNAYLIKRLYLEKDPARLAALEAHFGASREVVQSDIESQDLDSHIRETLERWKRDR
ncbi:MAG: rhomboid family intramembrane serine protease [Planctomycetota bacterium]